ncbi:MAG: uroporphyrinogen decarboxylase [Candidatus Latescibacterota bacterium]|nr:uroporphyrinogen decarboxylase [Candidatus Latescibacterota bacterium]
MMKIESDFLRSCFGLPTSSTPVWLMRQAGRILPQYRRLRSKHKSIQTLFTNPELASKITVMPIEDLGVDAAILYTDLVTPLGPLGCRFSYAPGPVFENPIRTESQIKNLKEFETEDELSYVTETVDMVCDFLPKHIPLIGYAGSPFTLAAWLVEGKSSKDFTAVRTLFNASPQAAHLLMKKLTFLVIDFLNAQINHGVKAVQIFDTSLGVISASTFVEFVLPYLKDIFNELSNQGVPRIYFPLGASHCKHLYQEIQLEVLSLDWRTSINDGYKALGSNGKSVQGNLDPTILYTDPQTITHAVEIILDQVGNRPHIFNLGHGLQPDMPYENVQHLIKEVKRISQRSRIIG